MPANTRPASSAGRSPGDDYEVARFDVVHAVSDLLDNPRRFMSEQEWKLVVYRAFSIMKVGVTHAARLHPHKGFAWAGVGHEDGSNFDFDAFGGCYHSSDFVGHENLLCDCNDVSDLILPHRSN